MELSLLIVDLAEISRKGLIALVRSYAGFHVLGEAKNIGEALEFCRSRQPDVVLFQTEVITEQEKREMLEIRNICPTVSLFVIASKAAPEDAIAALKAGARGFMTTDVDIQTLLAAIRSVAKGEVALSRGAMIHLVDFLGVTDERAKPSIVNGVRPRPKLTAREAQVLGLVSQGSSNRVIAASLVISEHTVRAHLRNILDKLGLENRIQAATWAAKLGLDTGAFQSGSRDLGELAAAGFLGPRT